MECTIRLNSSLKPVVLYDDEASALSLRVLVLFKAIMHASLENL